MTKIHTIVYNLKTKIFSIQHFNGIIYCLVIAALGISLGLQGWKSKILSSFDMIPYVYRAQAFIDFWQIPDRGTVCSYGTFISPGATWLMLPGMCFFSDPRLFECVGAILLYIGTLIGIYRLAHLYFGKRCAFLAVGLYAFSGIGLATVNSLWPRTPLIFFYVWMVYWASLWVMCRDAKYLAAAILTWAIGMYVYIEIAPGLFIIPAIWLIYRPPIRFRSLLIAAGLILIIWYPYLRFECSRNFIDLRSQVFRQEIHHTNYKDAWCNPKLNLRLREYPSITREMYHREMALKRKKFEGMLYIGKVLEGQFYKLLNNFIIYTQPPWLSILFLLLIYISVIVSLQRFFLRLLNIISGSRLLNTCLRLISISMILFGFLANEFIIARYLSPDGVLEDSVIYIRFIQILFIISGIIILLQNKVIPYLKKQIVPHKFYKWATQVSKDAWPIALSLIIPWLFLQVVVYPKRLERFWWLWPLQVIFLSAFFTNVLSRLRLSKLLVRLSIIILCLSFVASPLLSRLNSWHKSSSWFGSDPYEVLVVDYIAECLHREAKSKAAIGYRVFINDFCVIYNIIDSTYKAGAQFDLLFKYRHGIINTNRCAEGASPNDEYRVVQTKMDDHEGVPPFFVDINACHGFQVIKQFKGFQVLKRNSLLSADEIDFDVFPNRTMRSNEAL